MANRREQELSPLPTNGNESFYYQTEDLIEDLAQGMLDFSMADIGLNNTAYRMPPNLVRRENVPLRSLQRFLMSGETFDVVLSSYALNRFRQGMMPSVLELTGKILDPKLIIIQDYDLTGVSLAGFKDTFSAQLEQRILERTFDSNWEKAFKHFSQYPIDSFRDALKNSGFNIIFDKHGEGNAATKFTLVGQSRPTFGNSH